VRGTSLVDTPLSSRAGDLGSLEKSGMTGNHGRFVWYELLTTDIASAEAFYHQVLGWSAQDASTSRFAYRVLAAEGAPVSGLMALPPEGLQRGATPRWVGYVAVDDIDAGMGRLKALGGTTYVPTTDSNIGRIAIIADPQTATLALVQGLTIGVPPNDAEAVGRVGWHELWSAERRQAFAFYQGLLGWQKADSDVESAPDDDYQLFAAGSDTLGGIFTKPRQAPVSFWLYYFNVVDLTVALQRVTEFAGRVMQGPIELPDGNWIARCIDPQGAMFALRGRRSGAAADDAPPFELRWAAEWGGFASRGRLIDKQAGSSKPAPRSASAKKPPAKR
jgi:predicted enzyme related to lactoylglutathione lyase